MFDWAHCYVCGGIADVEFGTFTKSLHTLKRPTTYKELGRYLAPWAFPKAFGKLDHLFSEPAIKTNLAKGSFSCTASEFLTMTPVLARYVSKVCVPRGHDMAMVESMLAVLRVVEILQAVRRGVIDAESLRTAIVGHVRLYIEAYGDDAVRPKHHYVMHLPDALLRFGTLIGTLTNERKHRMVKRFAGNRANLARWELGAVEDLSCQEAHAISKPFTSSSQTTSKAHPKALAVLRELHPDRAEGDFALHAQVQVANGTAKSGDAVLLEHESGLAVGELIMSFSVQGPGASETSSALALWREMQSADDPRMAQYRLEESTVVVRTSALLCACAHRLLTTERPLVCICLMSTALKTMRAWWSARA